MNRRGFLLAGTSALIATPAAAQGWLEDGLDILKDVLGDSENGGVNLPGTGDLGGLGNLTVGEVASGLKQALEVSTGRSVSRVGQLDGYFKDADIRIPLPDRWSQAQNMMSNFGMSGMLDDLELRLNRGAETAAPYAKDLFVNAISAMTFDDVMGVFNGPDDAATRYFEGAMTPQLKTTFQPIIDRELNDAGAFKALDDVDDRLSSMPLVPSLGSNARSTLISHGLDFALSGLFHYVAKEEAAIRNNPGKRSTELLKRVFG